MAQLISVKLSRFDGSPWGFRLQGGKDFGTPLIVQKVNGGSPAEAAGLRAGDAVIKVNNTDMYNLRHKDAQDVIVRAGNNFEMTVQRGGSTWRPSVAPVTPTIPSPQPSTPASCISPVTKTSLAAKKHDVPHIGSGHNFSPKPFLNGTGDGHIKSIVNKQYNSPVGIYSEETIAETLSAQAEVLAGGVLGVNFKKNERNYNAENSEVFKMVQEADKEPKTPEPVSSRTEFYSSVSHAVGGRATSPRSPTPLGRLFSSSNSYNNESTSQWNQQRPFDRQGSSAYTSSGSPICSNCDSAIVGVFVRIKDKNLHVECFKCSTCGTSLKNVGYYNINGKLYCDIHAKLVARQNAPAGLAPITIPPGGKAPAGTISAALSNIGPLSPPLSNHGSSPQPFSSCNRLSPEPKRQEQKQPAARTNGYHMNGYRNVNKDEYNGTNGCVKTYTSTLTIQTGGSNEVGSVNGDKLDHNRNTTNLKTSHKPVIDNVCDIVFDPIISEERNAKETSHLKVHNNEFSVNQPTRLGASPVDSPSLHSVQAPLSNNISGPKPFGGSSYSQPSFNSESNTLPRPQSQTVTERYFAESASYEVVEKTKKPTSEKPPTPKAKCMVWPPTKPIEDITYPTASPIYIDPNPDRRSGRDRRPSVEYASCEQSRRNSLIESYESFRAESDMENVSCSGPVYRRVDLCGVQRRETRQSRSSSTDSVRRSLTPTRITQPIPRPWTATVTSGTNVYQQAYAPPPEPEPKICRKYHERRMCEEISESEGGQRYHEEKRAYHENTMVEETAPMEQQRQQTDACTCVCTTQRDEEKAIERKEVERDVETEKLDLSKIVPPDVAICPKGIDSEHDLYTETTEKDVGDFHIKKTTTYEKTVELVSPDQEIGHPMSDFTEKKSVSIDREVEDISEKKEFSSTVVSSKIDTMQLIEQAKRAEEEEKRQKELEEIKKMEEEERKRRMEEQRRREAEERRRREEEERRRKEEEERKWRAELEARVRKQEEEEKVKKRVCFSEHRKYVSEETKSSNEKIIDIEVEGRPPSRERIIDIELEERPASREHIIDIEVEGRPASRERIIDIELEQDQPQFETCQEYKKEMQMQECYTKEEIEENRRKSLREQVQVHQSLREQQAPEKRQQTLQERRLCARYGQKKESSQDQSETTCKKHVQFIKHTESGPVPLHSPVKNSTPKEWKSEMVKALTTAPERPYSPFTSEDGGQTTSKQLYSREIRYEETYGPPPEPNLPELPPQRPISPFQEALTTAPDRPYTPLGQDVDMHECTCGRRSQTPTMQNTAEGYCPPAQILYTETKSRESSVPRKPEGPQPLPTPPPDYRLRSRSASPTRSRSGTPSSRFYKTGLKKPDAIPSYQRNLIAVRSVPVDGQSYDPSRTPTPTPGRSKSPAQGPPDPPACYIRAQAPKVKDASSRPASSKEDYHYHYEEDTPQSHKSRIYTKHVDYQDESSSGQTRIHEHRSRESSVEERFEENSVVRRTKKTHFMDEHTDKIEKKSAYEVGHYCPGPESSNCCYISENSRTKPSLPCPVARPSGSEKFPKTGVRVLPPIASSEVHRIVHEVPAETSTRQSTCPETGVTVIPCKAHSDAGSKTGVVVVPCDRPSSTCNPSGVCITPTPDRSGVCVSPCPTQSGGICTKPSCYCGAPAGTCTIENSDCSIDAGTCKGTGVCVKSCDDGSSYCVTPCSVTGVRSVQCPKPILKNQKPNHPFPQIPLPTEDPPNSSCKGCPRSCSGQSSGGCDRGFEPIHKPRTNLGSQLTRLTVRPTNKPTVQLYKPQPQTQTQSQCFSRTQYMSKTETSSSSSCQDQIHCTSRNTHSLVDPPNLSSHPDLGTGVGGFGGSGGSKSGSFAGSSAPKRGRGILNQAGGPGSRVPLCAHCKSYVRGPFITALGQIWCPEHFVCVNPQCRRGLQDIGFVEEKGDLYCEYCFERFIAPSCDKCNNKIKGDCLNAIGKHFHPECFNCTHCGKLFGNSPFFLEEGLPYCEADWNNLFTTKCFACGFPVEAGDRWVEALNNNYHSQCFNCTMCKKNLEGQSFYAKGGRPFCKNHAR